ncbi:MAG: alpha/beta hydrolase family protein, partial [Acidimicrobiia bacterium]
MPDARVEAAIANWAPRFVSQGVDYNDFVRTTARIDRWEDWLPAWSETAALHAGLGAEAAGRGNSLTA